MSGTLNLISTYVQGYGPSETSTIPCFRVSGKPGSICSGAGSVFKSCQVKIINAKRSLKHTPFVCKAGSNSQRRNPDFPRNRNIYSRNRNRYNEERDNSENSHLGESEFVSTKNGPILSLSNSPQSNSTVAPGQKEKEIVELFRKVQAKLRERSTMKEEKKLDTVRGQNKESETVDSLLKLLRKHSSEQGQRKVNGGNTSEFRVDRPSKVNGRKSYGDESRSFSSPTRVVKEVSEEAPKPSFGRPVSNFSRRSPVPKVRFEPIVSTELSHDSVVQPELDVNTNGSYYEPVPDFESESESELESYVDPILDIASGLEVVQEEEVEEAEAEEEGEEEEEEEEEVYSEIGSVGEGDLLEAEVDAYDEKDVQKKYHEVKDLNGMKLVELRALAKSRGMKGFSKLKKSELIGLLSDDSGIP
ncbi:rho-N domain-containing protein 1, chloroplastic-like [Silene latifolia]|uniref:rho-N domain-containing protein 1, chloroplastic-like n=1 Tax=Silene latifolia TaxID=37657 RepID=UPI003D76CB4D